MPQNPVPKSTVSRRKQRPTMADIAVKLGLTQPTVSIVLNGLAEAKRISAETQQLVLACAAELGYPITDLKKKKPKPASASHHLVGFVIPTLTFSYWPEVVAGAEDFLAARGYRILLSHTGFDSQKEL